MPVDVDVVWSEKIDEQEKAKYQEYAEHAHVPIVHIIFLEKTSLFSWPRCVGPHRISFCELKKEKEGWDDARVHARLVMKKRKIFAVFVSVDFTTLKPS